MSSFNDLKVWIISEERKITKENFKDIIKVLAKDYENQSDKTEAIKIQEFNILLNMCLRFLPSSKKLGKIFSKQLINLPPNLEGIGGKLIKNVWLWELLDFTREKLNPRKNEILEQLIKLNLYKKNLEDYTLEERENIFKTIIAKKSEISWKSYYLSESEFKKSNLKLFIESKQFKDLLPENIEELGKKELQDKGLWNLLEFSREGKHHKTNEIQKQLIKLNLYKKNLEDYTLEERRDIFNTIIRKNSNSNWNSYYLSESEFKESNLKLFIESKQFKDLLPENIEEFNNELHRNEGLWKLIGFTWEKNKKPKKKEIQKQLLNQGTYKNTFRLCSTKERENIFKTIIKRKTDSNWKSYYLYESEFKYENREIFKNSKEFKTLLPENIEEIDSILIQNKGVWGLIGFTWTNNIPNKKEILRQAISANLYKNNLEMCTIEERKNIFNTIIRRNSDPNWRAYYLCESEFKENNKILFKNSNQFKEFLKKSNKQSIKIFLNKYNFSEQIFDNKIKYSILNAQWTNDEVNLLFSLYNEKKEELINLIKNTNLSYEKFGRSKNAVLIKLSELINQINSKNSGAEYKITSKSISSFPIKISEVLPEIINYSILHEEKIILNEFPIIEYNYPYNNKITPDTCFVLILPIIYQGNNLENYKSFQQYIISSLYSKLININSNELIETNKILEIKIDTGKFKIFSNKTSLVGIYVRAKFSLNDEIDTCEIKESIPFENEENKKFNYWIFNEN